MAACRGTSLSLLACAVALLGPSGAGAADTTRYLPDDTDLVVSVNLRQVIDSPVFQKNALADVKAWLKSDPRAQAISLVGLDPLRDLQRIILGGPSSTDLKERWVADVQGHFDITTIEAAADLAIKIDPSALTIDKHQGVRLYQVRDKKHSRPPIFAAFVDKTNLVFSPVEDWVAEAIDKAAGKKETTLNEDLQTLLGRQDDSQSLWLAGVPVQLENELAGNPRLRNMVGSVQTFSGTMHLSTDLKAQMRFVAANLRAGMRLRRLLELERAVAVLAITNNENLQDRAPLLTGILTTLQLSQDRDTVVIDASITDNLLARWMHPKKRSTAPPPDATEKEADR